MSFPKMGCIYKTSGSIRVVFFLYNTLRDVLNRWKLLASFKRSFIICFICFSIYIMCLRGCFTFVFAVRFYSPLGRRCGQFWEMYKLKIKRMQGLNFFVHYHRTNAKIWLLIQMCGSNSCNWINLSSRCGDVIWSWLHMCCSSLMLCHFIAYLYSSKNNGEEKLCCVGNLIQISLWQSKVKVK